MNSVGIVAGIAATAAAAAWLCWLGARGVAPARFPPRGWCGLALLAALELALALHLAWIRLFFTALVWTAYILALDGAIYRRRGHSPLQQRGPFLALALLSIPGWLVFEAFNLRLHNWIYTGVPASLTLFCLGAAWAFATIYPGIFLTADLIDAAYAHRLRCRPQRWRPATGNRLMALGALLLACPLLAPAAWAPYLFAPVWAGFILLLDPVNRRFGWPSLMTDLETGRPGRAVSLLVAGAVCGIFWEFWNYWAAARWQYVFPILHQYRIFAMPLPGFIGFPPFALECFTMAVFLTHALLPPRLRIG